MHAAKSSKHVSKNTCFNAAIILQNQSYFVIRLVYFMININSVKKHANSLPPQF